MAPLSAGRALLTALTTELSRDSGMLTGAEGLAGIDCRFGAGAETLRRTGGGLRVVYLLELLGRLFERTACVAVGVFGSSMLSCAACRLTVGIADDVPLAGDLRERVEVVVDRNRRRPGFSSPGIEASPKCKLFNPKQVADAEAAGSRRKCIILKCTIKIIETRKKTVVWPASPHLRHAGTAHERRSEAKTTSAGFEPANLKEVAD